MFPDVKTQFRLMQTVTTAEQLRACVRVQRARKRRIAFVPTMGNLHDGHLALVRRARQVADFVVVSVFVNPMQFAPGEDYETYPRTLAADSDLLEQVQADVLFAPDVAVIYPGGTRLSDRLQVPVEGRGLEADFRPGFFHGVVTVVERLFELVAPDCAVFGEKDYQQLAVIRALARDLHWPIEIIGVPTVREADGLAMSSRNHYLTAAERRSAPLLNRELRRVAGQLRAGSRDYATLEQDAVQRLADAGFRPDYVCIRQAGTLQPLSAGEAAVILAAAWLGRARLIDNVVV
jgi:pantoate--beta-alanine ligase